jgi:uncharacterized membrane protein
MAPHWTVPHTIISPQQVISPQLPIPQPTPSPSASPSQFSISKLLPGGVIVGSGSSFLAITLLSFLGTTLISSGIWVIILAALIFTQSRSLFEKTYLFIIAVITNLFIFYIFQSWQINNPLQSGTNGLIVVVLLIILGGLLAFILMGISQIMDRLITKHF